MLEEKSGAYFLSDMQEIKEKYFLSTSKIQPSPETRKTYEKIRNFMSTFPLLRTESYRFILENQGLNSTQLAELYNQQHQGEKKKSASTFRTQKYNLGKIMYSILGNNFKVFFYGSDGDAIPEYDTRLEIMQFTLDTLSDPTYIKSAKLLLEDSVLFDEEDEGKIYSLEELKKEFFFIAKYSRLGFANDIEKMDTSKLRYILDVLNEDLYIRDKTDKVYRNEKSVRQKPWGTINAKKIQFLKILSDLASGENYSIFNTLIAKKQADTLEGKLQIITQKYIKLQSIVAAKDRRIEDLEQLLKDKEVTS